MDVRHAMADQMKAAQVQFGANWSPAETPTNHSIHP